MDDVFVNAIKRYESTVAPRNRALCGVSGGVDSVLLLRALVACGFEQIVVCHFNHRLRGRASQADQRFVEHLATSLKLTCEVGVSTSGSRGSEAVWREERFKFFQQIAKKWKTPFLFLGHHADDQAETVLWNLLRGAGRRGLGGMRSVSKREGLLLVRPFLDLPRRLIAQEAKKEGILFRADSSNKNTRFSRNKLRHLIIPKLERFLGRNIREPLAAAACILAEEDDFLDAFARQVFNNCGSSSGTLNVRKTTDLPVALQRRVIVQWLASHSVTSFGFDHIEAVRGILRPEPATRGKMAAVNLPGGIRIRRKSGSLFLEHLEQPGNAPSKTRD